MFTAAKAQARTHIGFFVKHGNSKDNPAAGVGALRLQHMRYAAALLLHPLTHFGLQGIGGARKYFKLH